MTKTPVAADIAPGSISAGDRAAITVPEAGQMLGISRRAAYDAVKRGDIPSVWIGRRLRVPLAALNALLGTPAAAAPTDTDAITDAVQAAVRDAIRDALRADGNSHA